MGSRFRGPLNYWEIGRPLSASTPLSKKISISKITPSNTLMPKTLMFNQYSPNQNNAFNKDLPSCSQMHSLGSYSMQSNKPDNNIDMGRYQYLSNQIFVSHPSSPISTKDHQQYEIASSDSEAENNIDRMKSAKKLSKTKSFGKKNSTVKVFPKVKASTNPRNVASTSGGKIKETKDLISQKNKKTIPIPACVSSTKENVLNSTMGKVTGIKKITTTKGESKKNKPNLPEKTKQLHLLHNGKTLQLQNKAPVKKPSKASTIIKKNSKKPEGLKSVTAKINENAKVSTDVNSKRLAAKPIKSSLRSSKRKSDEIDKEKNIQIPLKKSKITVQKNQVKVKQKKEILKEDLNLSSDNVIETCPVSGRPKEIRDSKQKGDLNISSDNIVETCPVSGRNSSKESKDSSPKESPKTLFSESQEKELIDSLDMTGADTEVPTQIYLSLNTGNTQQRQRNSEDESNGHAKISITKKNELTSGTCNTQLQAPTISTNAVEQQPLPTNPSTIQSEHNAGAAENSHHETGQQRTNEEEALYVLPTNTDIKYLDQLKFNSFENNFSTATCWSLPNCKDGMLKIEPDGTVSGRTKNRSYFFGTVLQGNVTIESNAGKNDIKKWDKFCIPSNSVWKLRNTDKETAVVTFHTVLLSRVHTTNRLSSGKQ